MASSDIGQLVTNQQTSGWIQNKLSLPTQKQAEIRLSVERVTSVFSDSVTGMIRAVMYSRNLNLLFEEVCKHPVGKLQILTFDLVASRDTRLIGNYNKKICQQRLRGPTEIENTILKSEGVTSVDVAALKIHNAISV